MFLFIGVISATKENTVKHICFIMKWVIITHLKLYCDTILNSHPVNQSALWANSWIEKKRLEVNVGEKWNLLSFVVNIRKSRQYCLNENINDSLFIKWDKRERVSSDITKPSLPPSFWLCPRVPVHKGTKH